MACEKWKKHFDVYLYLGNSLMAHKVYYDVNKIKVNRALKTLEVFMDDGTSATVNPDRYVVEIRTRDKWGF